MRAPALKARGIDEGVDRNGRAPDGVRDPLGGVDPAAGRVDVEIRGGGAGCLGLAQAAGDVRREPVLDRAGHRDAVHHRRLAGRPGSRRERTASVRTSCRRIAEIL